MPTHIDSYMGNLSDEECKEADIILAGTQEDSSEDAKTASSTPPDEDWQLPCHSLMLSGVSKSLSSAKSHAREMACERNEEGKRVVRMKLTKAGATKFLFYCYGVLTSAK